MTAYPNGTQEATGRGRYIEQESQEWNGFGDGESENMRIDSGEQMWQRRLALYKGLLVFLKHTHVKTDLNVPQNRHDIIREQRRINIKLNMQESW